VGEATVLAMGFGAGFAEEGKEIHFLALITGFSDVHLLYV
jgi:hypothetical protein